MKKIISILLSTIMLFSVSSVALSALAAEPKSATIYATVSNADLKFEIVQEPIVVKDLNNDNILTIDEAFKALHEQKYVDSLNGYQSDGSSMSKFWGIAGYNFMYFLNNSDTEIASTTLQTPIKEGDFLNAIILKDTDTYSDSFSYFQVNSKTMLQNDSISFTLMKKSMFDTAPVPAANATITIDGLATSYKTDANGKVNVKVDEIGSHIMSAISDEYVLAPAACKIDVKPSSVKVFFTIVDNNKNVVISQEPIVVTDTNADHKLDLLDAFLCVHDQKFTGGAANGFATQMGPYGLSITKLWGIENGGSYGYYQNNNMAMGLTDAISENDYIDAFVYSDAPGYSDQYTFFDKPVVDAGNDNKAVLTLYKYEYDPVTYAPIKVAVENAKIFINGAQTEYKTDANGQVQIEFDKNGTFTITAKSNEFNMVPSVCKVNVSNVVAQSITTNDNDKDANDEVKSPQTGSESFVILPILMLAIGTIALAYNKKSNSYEK